MLATPFSLSEDIDFGFDLSNRGPENPNFWTDDFQMLIHIIINQLC